MKPPPSRMIRLGPVDALDLTGQISKRHESGEGGDEPGAFLPPGVPSADTHLFTRARARFCQRALYRARTTPAKRRFVEGRHIAAALRTHSGAIYSGVHIEAYIGRVTVRGEAIAIGAAATAGNTKIEIIVAVNELGEVVSPCGMCRELIGDYSPSERVIIPRSDESVAVSIAELLLDKYQR